MASSMMREREPDEVHHPPVEAAQVNSSEPALVVEPIEPGRAVRFALLPGQKFEVSVTADGIVQLQVTTLQSSELVSSIKATESPSDVSPAETQERVAMSGRVGTAPTFRTTPRGVRIGRFKLAEHDESGSTAWHTVIAFGTRADQLEREPLGKGDSVEVVGYRHERQAMQRGVSTTVVEVYATAIRRR
jgi:hypothetical protein